jgi:tetrahydromethanopterin S-methyltransferase subunit G
MTLTPYRNFVESMDMSKLELQEQVNTVGAQLLASWQPTGRQWGLLAGLLAGAVVGIVIKLVVKILRR